MSLKKWIRSFLALALMATAFPLAAQLSSSGGYSKGTGMFLNFAIYKPSDVLPAKLLAEPRAGVSGW